MISHHLEAFLAKLHRKGFAETFLDLAYRRLINPVVRRLTTRLSRKILDDIIAGVGENGIIVLPSSIGWHHDLYQRSQHMALQLANEGFVYFYAAKPRWPEERVQGFQRVSRNCYVTNRIDLLLSLRRSVIIHVYSPDVTVSLNFLRERQEIGDTILYEFIDEIHPGVMGQIPESIHRRHHALLLDETVYCTASADRLLQQVSGARKKRFALVTNGVDVDHFRRPPPPEPPEKIKKLLSLRKPIIGYYGAIAPWLDYDLIRTVAETDRFSLCLIGPLHMLSRFSETGLESTENVHWLGPVAYEDLPSYASFFDIATIPFLLNDVTESTSPVKLFEYMAMEKPIVTTNMRECRKYRSVIIAHTADDFILKLDQILNDPIDSELSSTLRAEASDNSWSAKAREVSQLLRGYGS